MKPSARSYKSGLGRKEAYLVRSPAEEGRTVFGTGDVSRVAWGRPSPVTGKRSSGGWSTRCPGWAAWPRNSSLHWHGWVKRGSGKLLLQRARGAGMTGWPPRRSIDRDNRVAKPT